MNWFEFSLGLIAGLFVGIFGNLLVLYWQFQYSPAKYRLRNVQKASKEFRDSAHSTAVLRNKHRYSLGVIIDNIITMDHDGLNHHGVWPFLVENGDRWSLFDRYVRPVMEEIAPHLWLGKRWFPRSYGKQICTLYALCQQLEIVVAELDAAFENPPVVQFIDHGIQSIATNDVRVKRVRKAYRDLSQAWKEWMKLV